MVFYAKYMLTSIIYITKWYKIPLLSSKEILENTFIFSKLLIILSSHSNAEPDMLFLHCFYKLVADGWPKNIFYWIYFFDIGLSLYLGKKVYGVGLELVNLKQTFILYKPCLKTARETATKTFIPYNTYVLYYNQNKY